MRQQTLTKTGREMMNRRIGRALIVVIAIGISICLSACTALVHRADEFNATQVDVPAGMESAETDADPMKESSCVLGLTDDSGSATLGGERLSGDALAAKIKERLDAKTPEYRVVYIEGVQGLQFRTVVNVLRAVTKADVDRASLIVHRRKDVVETVPHVLQIRLTAEETPYLKPMSKPNPLTLVAILEKDGRLLLNNDPIATLASPDPLTAKLMEVFKEREYNGVFREGTNEIEKGMWVKAPLGARYADVCRLVDIIKLAGAHPIGLQLDSLTE